MNLVDQIRIEESPVVFCKEYTINMPQMCIKGLSENWLFKTLGSAHWELLCKGLSTQSSDLKDCNGNRLYASFVRIRLSGNTALNEFKENEIVNLTGKIKRFGNSMYFSEFEMHSLQDQNKEFKAELITIFSIRQGSSNQKLVKSKSELRENNIESLATIPEFGLEYRMIKMNKLTTLRLTRSKFDLTKNEILFECEHSINPYYEVNGVGLLYFAAYPTINDACEARYFNKQPQNELWQSTFFTSSRDVMYYANCNMNDSIIYRLHFATNIDNHTIKIQSSLYRKSDGVLMAKVFTIKKRREIFKKY